MLEEREALVRFHAQDRTAGGHSLAARQSESDARIGDRRGGTALSSAPASPSIAPAENGENVLSPAKAGLFSRAASRAASFWRKSSAVTDERQTTLTLPQHETEPQPQPTHQHVQSQYPHQPRQQTQMLQMQMPTQQHSGHTPQQVLWQHNQAPAMNFSLQNSPQALQGSPHVRRTPPRGNNLAVQSAPGRALAFPVMPMPAQGMMRSPHAQDACFY